MSGLSVAGGKRRSKSHGKSKKRKSVRRNNRRASRKSRSSRTKARKTKRRASKTGKRRTVRSKRRRRAAAKDPCREFDGDSKKCRASKENFCFYNYEDKPPSCKTLGSAEAFEKKKKEVMEANRAKGYLSRREQRKQERKNKSKVH